MKLEKVDSKKPRWNAIECRRKINEKTLYGHYLWCKKEGRDINWYDKEKSSS